MKIVFAAAIAALLFSGCADKTPASDELGGIPEKAPAWIQDPDIAGRFAATGGATQSIGGVRFQQIEARARASEILRARIEKIAISAATACLNALATANSDTIDADARLASLMIGARASSQFERADNWWSPSRDYYALLRISEDKLEETMIDAIGQFIKSNETYSLNFGMLRDVKLIENAARNAIDAAK
ncbi:MAG: hypothetical protein LBF86_05850 [Helicobacteraceae bacterium]|jgi:hypothetical protein|nr:hypothetical protein [Helicobacteraceae bacterium]